MPTTTCARQALSANRERPEVAPNADEYQIFTEANDQYNTIIAGNVGSGKSIFEAGMIYNLLNRYTPEECGIYLIDPKRVELIDFIGFPHIRGYAREVAQAVRMLETVKDEMLRRYDWMAECRQKKFPGGHIYVFIDELADIMLEARKEASAIIQKIMQLGRAARVHIVVCTQTAARLTIPAAMQINFTCRIGLKLDDAIDSRQIVKVAGCENLPPYGKCILRYANVCEERDVPMYEAVRFNAMYRYWIGLQTNQ